jgi:hypothetical protein
MHSSAAQRRSWSPSRTCWSSWVTSLRVSERSDSDQLAELTRAPAHAADFCANNPIEITHAAREERTRYNRDGRHHCRVDLYRLQLQPGQRHTARRDVDTRHH